MPDCWVVFVEDEALGTDLDGVYATERLGREAAKRVLKELNEVDLGRVKEGRVRVFCVGTDFHGKGTR
jgi:hypothetical protein